MVQDLTLIAIVNCLLLSGTRPEIVVATPNRMIDHLQVGTQRSLLSSPFQSLSL